MKTTSTSRILATVATLGALAAFSFAALFAQETKQPVAPQETISVSDTTTDADPAVLAAPATKKDKKRGSSNNKNDSPQIVTYGDITVPADKTVNQVVALRGNILVDGTVARQAVAILGNVQVNGHVKGQVVVVGGGVELGPDARVDGQIVALGGPLKKAEGASNGGQVVQFKVFNDISGFNAWLTKALSRGSLLAFGAGLAWAWLIAGIFLLLYLITAALFPKAAVKCAETLELHPGTVFLSALITAIVKPIISLLLAVTGIGLLVLIPASLALAIFGKTAILAWAGRRITLPLKLTQHPVLAVLIGGVLIALLYCVPVLGILLWKFTGFLGTGAVVYAVILALRRRSVERAAARAAERAALASASANAAATVAATANPVSPGVSPETTPPPPATSPAAATAASAALAPRAGFWIRTGALLIDWIIVAVIAASLNMGKSTAVLFAIYCVILWAARGATLGGIVCGLKIVRADGHAMDWTTAFIRALGGFIAMLPFGLGFIWVAIDADRQGWHDKIAGTIVVHAPKGQSLV